MRKRFLKWALRVLLVIITLSLAANLYFYWGYRQAQNELRSLGYPTTFTELQEWGALENPEDSAHIPIQEAFAKMTWDLPMDLELPYTNGDCGREEDTGPFSDDVLNDIKIMLDANGDALDILRNARHIRSYRPQLSREFSWNARTDSSAKFRAAARFLSEASIYYAGTGDAEMAIEHIDTVLWLVEMLGQYPETIELLVANAIGGIGYGSAQMLTERYDLSPAELRTLIAITEDRGRAYDPTRALVGASVMQNHEASISDVFSGFLSADTFDKRFLYVMDEFPQDLWHFCSGGHFNILALQSEDFITFQKVLDQDPSYQDIVDQGLSAWESDLSYGELFAKKTWTVYFDPLYLYESRIETTIAGLKVQLFRRENIHLPETLDVLVPDFSDEIPIDPMTGVPLKYSILENGFEVYSLGLDRDDCHKTNYDDGEPCHELIEFSIQHPRAVNN